VSQHLPWLKPAAANKMFNAELVVKRSPGSPVIPTGYPVDADTNAANYSAVLPLLVAASERKTLVIPEMENVRRSTFEAWIGSIDSADVIEAISAIQWISDDYYQPDIAFLGEIARDVEKWVVIAPQTEQSSHLRELPGVGSRTVFKRGLKPPA